MFIDKFKLPNLYLNRNSIYKMHRTVNQITKEVIERDFPSVVTFDSFLGVAFQYRTLCQRAGLTFKVICAREFPSYIQLWKYSFIQWPV